MKDITHAAGGVQSLHRALDLLEVVADRGGPMAIGEIATIADLPLPTIHRLLRTLVDRGYMRQLPDRRYALGFRLVALGSSAGSLVGAGSDRVLSGLVAQLGETANLAILSSDTAEYVAQAPSPHTMRTFTEVGRRVMLHSTGVGKALLAQMDERWIAEFVRRSGLPGQTPHSITTEGGLREAVERIRLEGHALDEEEQELGVRCVAVPVPGDVPVPMAVSVSGPVTRMTDDLIARAIPLLHGAARELADSHFHALAAS